MKKCTCCKLELVDVEFGCNLQGGMYKLCAGCRTKGRIANAKRKEARSNQSKEHYEKNKQEIKIKNRLWREENKEKLQAYESLPERKEKNKQWRIKKREEDRYRFVWYAAKRRAKQHNIIFTITKQDIIDVSPIDNRCPILGIILEFGNKTVQDNSPSLDRLIPHLGYVPGNIALISHRANRIKNDATVDELEKVFSFMKRLDVKND
jgi:hypothetical protein